MEVAIIIGAIRQERKTHRVAYYLQTEIEKQGLTATVIDLKELTLPLYGTGEEAHEHVAVIKEILVRADGMIFISPEYQGTYTAALKNFTEYYLKEFYRKPIGVVTTSTGAMGGINASTHLQLLVLSLQAYPAVRKLLVSDIANVLGDDFLPKTEKLTAETNKFLKEYLWLLAAVANHKRNTE